MARHSAEETRARLLETGMQMLREQGVAAGVQHIRLQDVVERAGVTTGAAYNRNVWADGQKGFHRDLALAAVQWRDDWPLTRTLRAIRHLVDGEATMAEVIRVGAAAQVEGLTRHGSRPGPSDGFRTALALRASASNDEDLRAASGQRHRESVAAFSELYERLLGLYGREMRPPFTVQHLADALAAAADGYALQAVGGHEHAVVTLEGEDGGAGPAGEWTMLGVVTAALVEALTRPAASRS